jgi:hypothetical protein
MIEKWLELRGRRMMGSDFCDDVEYFGGFEKIGTCSAKYEIGSRGDKNVAEGTRKS